MKQVIIFLLLFGIVMNSLLGQALSRHVYSCSGSSLDETGYYVSYTIGQVGFQTLKNTDNAITEGFQQPLYRVHLPSGRFVEAYPNPVHDFLKVNISVKERMDIVIDILSITGAPLSHKEVKGLNSFGEYSLDFRNFPQGLYLMHVYSPADRNIDGIFKIEKI